MIIGCSRYHWDHGQRAGLVDKTHPSLRQTRIQYPGATLDGKEGHYPTPGVKGMSCTGVVRKNSHWDHGRIACSWTQRAAAALAQRSGGYRQAPAKELLWDRRSNQNLGSNQLKSSKIEDLTNKDWGFTALLREMVGIAFNLTIKNRHFNRQFFAKRTNLISDHF